MQFFATPEKPWYLPSINDRKWRLVFNKRLNPHSSTWVKKRPRHFYYDAYSEVLKGKRGLAKIINYDTYSEEYVRKRRNLLYNQVKTYNLIGSKSIPEPLDMILVSNYDRRDQEMSEALKQKEPVLIQSFVQRYTLRDWMRKGQRELGYIPTLEILERIALFVKRAHDKGVALQILSPDHVLIGYERLPMYLGSANFCSLIGSGELDKKCPAYLATKGACSAPEIHRVARVGRGKVTKSCDVFSIGCIGFYLYSGVSPNDSTTPEGYFDYSRHMKEQVREKGSGFANLLARCLCEEKERICIEDLITLIRNSLSVARSEVANNSNC